MDPSFGLLGTKSVMPARRWSFSRDFRSVCLAREKRSARMPASSAGSVVLGDGSVCVDVSVASRWERLRRRDSKVWTVVSERGRRDTFMFEGRKGVCHPRDHDDVFVVRQS